MDADRFLMLLDHPEKAELPDIESLKSLIQQFPYFNKAQKLLGEISTQKIDGAFQWLGATAIQSADGEDDFLKSGNEIAAPAEDLFFAGGIQNEVAVSDITHALDEQERTDITLSYTPMEGESTLMLEEELEDEIAFRESEEFILWNESGGSGSENVPTEESLEEETNEDFAIETDPEIAAVSVLEEEFILHEKEEMHAGGSNVNANTDELPSFADEPVPQQETPSFLPDKKLSFVQWLQFFKKDKKPSVRVKQNPSIKKIKESELPEESLPELPDKENPVMKKELEQIDKIIGRIGLVKQEDSGDVDINAADLAKKALSWMMIY